MLLDMIGHGDDPKPFWLKLVGPKLIVQWELLIEFRGQWLTTQTKPFSF